LRHPEGNYRYGFVCAPLDEFAEGYYFGRNYVDERDEGLTFAVSENDWNQEIQEKIIKDLRTFIEKNK